MRELERRWEATRLVEDEAAYLLERVRAGELDPRRLALAATCGQPAARAALGVQLSASTSYDRLLDHLGAVSKVLTREVAACAVEVLLDLIPEQGPEARAALGAATGHRLRLHLTERDDRGAWASC